MDTLLMTQEELAESIPADIRWVRSAVAGDNPPRCVSVVLPGHRKPTVMIDRSHVQEWLDSLPQATA